MQKRFPIMMMLVVALGCNGGDGRATSSGTPIELRQGHSVSIKGCDSCILLEISSLGAPSRREIDEATKDDSGLNQQLLCYTPLNLVANTDQSRRNGEKMRLAALIPALLLASDAFAFQIWVQGDTQKMVESSGGSNVVQLGGLTRGLCERNRILMAEGSSLARIIHVGDIVQLYYSTVLNTNPACTVCTEWYGQWERASGAYEISESCGIAGSYVLGNHDIKSTRQWDDLYRAYWWRLAFHGSASSPLRNYGSGPNYWFDNPANDPGSVGGIETVAIQHVAGDIFVAILPYGWTAAMEHWLVDTIASEPALQSTRVILASHATVYPPAGAPTEHDPAAGSPMRITSAASSLISRLEDPVSQGGSGTNVVAVVGGHYRPNVDLDILVPFAWDLEPGGSYLRVFANAQTLATGGAGWGVVLEVNDVTGSICVWDEDMVFDEGTLKYGGSQLCATPN